ncbi:MAG: hypothetical protein H6717_37610 [Polyangiaceae bacterium]|nr:hypothetical protein [Polyangiaceae bacterium]
MALRSRRLSIGADWTYDTATKAVVNWLMAATPWSIDNLAVGTSYVEDFAIQGCQCHRRRRFEHQRHRRHQPSATASSTPRRGCKITALGTAACRAKTTNRRREG